MDRYTPRDRDTPQMATIHLDKRRIQSWVGTLLSMLFSVGAGAGTVYVGQRTIDNQQEVHELKTTAVIAESTARRADQDTDAIGQARAQKDAEHDTEIRVLKELHNQLLQFCVATRSSATGRRIPPPKPIDPHKPLDKQPPSAPAPELTPPEE